MSIKGEFFDQAYLLPIKYCKRDRKPMFTKKQAVTAANKRYRDQKVKLRIYHCQACNHWHLTKQLK